MNTVQFGNVLIRFLRFVLPPPGHIVGCYYTLHLRPRKPIGHGEDMRQQ